MNILFNAFLHILMPFAFIRLLYKSRNNPEYRHHIAERFAFKLPPALPNTILVHAVSVGEFIAIRPLLDNLLAAYPKLNLWITCTTPTGRAQIKQFQQNNPQRVIYSYLPYDTKRNIQRILLHIRPCLIILMETEIWPNLIYLAKKQHIPVLLCNARLSARSLRGYYRYARAILREPLKHLFVDAQTRFDARRFHKLGVPADHINIIPNLKYQAPIKENTRKINFPRQSLTWIAASTHTGEDETIIAAHCLLQKTHTDACLIIAPRHPERRDTITKIITKFGYRPRLCSQQESISEAKDILILDTLGELKDYYHIIDIAFIGGSLIPHGGHNPLEALHADKPVIFGRSMYNFQSIRDDLIRQPFVRELTDNSPQTLATAVIALYNHPETDKIHTYMSPYQNIIKQHLQHIERLLK
ncbi:MAG: 3-deoxy-D-manno-octulosonic acid transferase [Cardiobacteriaceae bacterium]|nr:3-deoxy-D-manno-octulosonic acid transferase [Cardiobacteriaceae bacterium]